MNKKIASERNRPLTDMASFLKNRAIDTMIKGQELTTRDNLEAIFLKLFKNNYPERYIQLIVNRAVFIIKKLPLDSPQVLLSELKKDTNIFVRSAVAKAYGTIGEVGSAEEILSKLKGDPDKYVRLEVAKAYIAIVNP